MAGSRGPTALMAQCLAGASQSGRAVRGRVGHLSTSTVGLGLEFCFLPDPAHAGVQQPGHNRAFFGPNSVSQVETRMPTPDMGTTYFDDRRAHCMPQCFAYTVPMSRTPTTTRVLIHESRLCCRPNHGEEPGKVG